MPWNKRLSRGMRGGGPVSLDHTPSLNTLSTSCKKFREPSIVQRHMAKQTSCPTDSTPRKEISARSDPHHNRQVSHHNAPSSVSPPSLHPCMASLPARRYLLGILISSHLISSHLIPSHLISSHLISSHLSKKCRRNPGSRF